MDAPNAERLKANERRFRAVNERLRGDVAPVAGAGEPIEFVCECSSTECRETIPLTLDAYRALRTDPERFAVALHHETPAIERVVEQYERYSVVQKHED